MTSTKAKTRAVAVYPDGSRFVIKRNRGAYWYNNTDGSSHMSSVRENVARMGGKVVYEPNPLYRAPGLESLLGSVLGKRRK
jgi:hypothetical protein